MFSVLDSPYNKWIASALLVVGVLELDLFHFASRRFHIYLAALLVVYGCYIMFRVRWARPTPANVPAPPRHPEEPRHRGYAATVAIVFLLFLFRATFLIFAVAYFAHAAAEEEPALFSAIAHTTPPYVTMQFRHTMQIAADVLDLALPGQTAVLVNPKHWLALPFKGALSIVHTILIIGTGTIIFKLGMDRGALNEIEKVLTAGKVDLKIGAIRAH